MSKMESMVREFVAAIEDAVREQVAGEMNAAIESALGSVGTPGATGRHTLRFGRRTPEQLAATKDRLLKHIKAKPGQRSEQIAGELGLDTKELVLPIRGLLSTSRIKTTGCARGTQYFPA